MDGDDLTIRNSWPASTIQGEPAVVQGLLSTSKEPDGSCTLSIAVGPVGCGPEECDYTEFVLTPEQTMRLGRRLLDPHT